MMTENRRRYAPSCRPANPAECARCTLSYECQSKIRNGQSIHWPLVGLAIAGLLMVFVQVF